MKKIGCVILNYNDAETTITLLENIEHYETLESIVVVDNKSSDNSIEMLRRFIHGKIRLVEAEKNGGYGYGNNIGVKKLYEDHDCDLCIIANPDVFFDEDCISKLCDKFEQNDDLIICAPLQLNGFTKERIIGNSWKIPTFCDYVFTPLFLVGSIYKKLNRNSLQKTGKVECVPGAFLMVDSAKFMRIGGYDENVFLYCEESILGYKARENGFETYLIDDASYEHFHSVSINKTINKTVNQKKILFMSRLYYLRKYLHINSIETLIAKVAFRVAIFEEYIYRLVVRK